MSPFEKIMFAFTASIFAILALTSLIVLGEHGTRTLAILSAFFGTASQFTGQDPKAFKASIYLAYGALVSGAFAILTFALGN